MLEMLVLQLWQPVSPLTTNYCRARHYNVNARDIINITTKVDEHSALCTRVDKPNWYTKYSFIKFPPIHPNNAPACLQNPWCINECNIEWHDSQTAGELSMAEPGPDQTRPDQGTGHRTPQQAGNFIQSIYMLCYSIVCCPTYIVFNTNDYYIMKCFTWWLPSSRPTMKQPQLDSGSAQTVIKRSASHRHTSQHSATSSWLLPAS